MRTISTLVLIFLLSSTSIFAQEHYYGGPFYGGGYGSYPGLGAGMGGIGGVGGYPGDYNFKTENNTIPVFDNGLEASSIQYKNVKLNSKCPLLTTTSQDDGDMFSDLKTFLSTASKNPGCSLRQDTNGFAPSQNSVSSLENLLNGNDGSPMGGGVSSSSVKCYTQNVELISQRNLAYYYSEKEISQGYSAGQFSSCLSLINLETYGPASLEEKRECITKKYEEIIEDNKAICREMIAPQAVQKQINKALVGVEQILNQAIANKEECGFKAESLFKVTMNTFLKAKALSVVGPWGAVAGFGADLVGNLLDKLFPSDADKAAALMEEILNEETFEQNACLYFNIQQKMYCEDRPVEIKTPNPGCQNIAVTSELMKLLQKYKDIKKVTDTYSIPTPVPAPGSPYPNMSSGAMPAGVSPEMESALLDHLDDLSKYAISNENDLKERIKSLPKMQRSREQAKLEKFLGHMKAYQNYDPANDMTGADGEKIIAEIAALFISKNADTQLDLSMFVVKTTSGTNLDSIKQKSISRTVEQLMAVQPESTSQNEKSRTMAKFNKYKLGMASLAKNKFEARLEKQFKEFETQVKFVSSKDRGVVDDAVAEGQLRNLVRHCSLLQEVYDPTLEGKMPRVCQKLSCNTNKLGWFIPNSNQSNFLSFKQDYCDKSLGYQKTESDFVKDLKDKDGAKICGVKAESFF